MREVRLSRSDGTITRLQGLFSKNGWERSREELEWQFLNNPLSETWINAAESSDSLAAIYAALPNRFQLFEQESVCLQSLDTLTDEAFRGQGLFVKLASSLFGEAKSQELGFIYGFPNGNSRHGFFKKLDWKNYDPLPFLLRPINPSYFLPGMLKGLKLPQIKGFQVGARCPSRAELEDIDVEAIWDGFRGTFDVGLIRDRSYFEWRLAKPHQNYRIFALNDEGFIITNLMEKHGGRIGYVVEMMTRNGAADVELAYDLLEFGVRDLVDSGADAVLAWHFQHSPYFLSYLANGFLPLPERVRPIELHFGMLPLGAAQAVTRRDWYLSYCDSDTV
ncbi:GNAT family N-acetyltransferase [Microvenator marinus]|nr:GNAT family N-acetyltransferase [Microvenator marinus]